MLDLLDITTASGTPLRVFYIPLGNPGPINSTDRGASEPSVEFYDRRWHGRTGHGRQIGGRYRVHDLVKHSNPAHRWVINDPENDGECVVDAEAFAVIIEWLRIAVARNP